MDKPIYTWQEWEAEGMNNEALNKHLAEKIMGWHLKTIEHGFEIYFNGTGISQAALKNTYWDNPEPYWNPTENIEQAFMCLDMYDRVAIAKNIKQGWCCSVRNSGCKLWINSGWNKSLSMAASLAPSRATGWRG